MTTEPATFEEKIAALKAMLAEGRFHHATHRDHGKLWAGLFIYEKEPGNTFNGFKLAFSFPDSRGRAEQDAAYALVRHTGVSVGAYGKG